MKIKRRQQEAEDLRRSKTQPTKPQQQQAKAESSFLKANEVVTVKVRSEGARQAKYATGKSQDLIGAALAGKDKDLATQDLKIIPSKLILLKAQQGPIQVSNVLKIPLKTHKQNHKSDQHQQQIQSFQQTPPATVEEEKNNRSKSAFLTEEPVDQKVQAMTTGQSASYAKRLPSVSKAPVSAIETEATSFLQREAARSQKFSKTGAIE